MTGHMSTPEYAREELIAELGAAIACARIGISNTPRTNHAQYLRHWLTNLREDPKTLFKAMTAASKAVQYLDPNADSDYASNPAQHATVSKDLVGATA